MSDLKNDTILSSRQQLTNEIVLSFIDREKFENFLKDNTSPLYDNPIANFNIVDDTDEDDHIQEEKVYPRLRSLYVSREEIDDKIEETKKYNEGVDKKYQKPTNWNACKNILLNEKMSKFIEENGIDHETTTKQFMSFTVKQHYDEVEKKYYVLFAFPSRGKKQTVEDVNSVNDFINMFSEGQSFWIINNIANSYVNIDVNYALVMDGQEVRGSVNIDSAGVTPYERDSGKRVNNSLLIQNISYGSKTVKVPEVKGKKTKFVEKKILNGTGFTPTTIISRVDGKQLILSLTAKKCDFEIDKKMEDCILRKEDDYGFCDRIIYTNKILEHKNPRHAIKMGDARLKSGSDETGEDSDEQINRKSINLSIFSDKGEPCSPGKSFYGSAFFVILKTLERLSNSKAVKNLEASGVSFNNNVERNFINCNHINKVTIEDILIKKEKKSSIVIVYDINQLNECLAHLAKEDKKIEDECFEYVKRSFNMESNISEQLLGEKSLIEKIEKSLEKNADKTILASVKEYGIVNAIKVLLRRQFETGSFDVSLRGIDGSNDDEVLNLLEEADKNNSSILYLHFRSQKHLAKKGGKHVSLYEDSFWNKNDKVKKIGFAELRLAIVLIDQMCNGSNPTLEDRDCYNRITTLIEKLDTYSKIKAYSYLRLKKSLFNRDGKAPSNKERYVATQGVYFNVRGEIIGYRNEKNGKLKDVKAKSSSLVDSHPYVRSFFDLFLKKRTLRNYDIPYGYADENIDIVKTCYKDKADVSSLKVFCEHYHLENLFIDGKGKYIFKDVNVKNSEDELENTVLITTEIDAKANNIKGVGPYTYKIVSASENAVLISKNEEEMIKDATIKNNKKPLSFKGDKLIVAQKICDFGLAKEHNGTTSIKLFFKDKSISPIVIKKNTFMDVIILIDINKVDKEDFKQLLSKPEFHEDNKEKHPLYTGKNSLMAVKKGKSICSRTITRSAKDDSKNFFGVLSDRELVFFMETGNKQSISIVFKALNDPLNSSSDFTSSSAFFTYNVDENSLIGVDMPDYVKDFILNFVNSNLLSINSQSNQSVFEKTTRLAAGK